MCRSFSPVAAACFLLLYAANAGATWNSTGGSVSDASWSGDTAPLNGNTNVGALDGEGSVSGGAASYTIPIKVVPGRAGIQPSVSLSYSSNGGNGVAGVGWNLSAGSAVTRCAKTVAQDGVADKVHFLKSKDRLCLNGQRLVAVTGGYGNSGTEYRTELDQFVKVVQSGDMDGSSTSFTVYHKNGIIDYFGQTVGSRHSLQGITRTSSWKINKSTDVSGNNSINYIYASHGNGEYTLSSINYTGQGASLGDRYVSFEYESRPDTRNGFQSGGSYARTKRLASITTKFQSQIVRQYRFTYEQSTTSGNSLLKSAEECGYEGATVYCFPATEFEWYENAPTYKFEPLQYIQANGQKVHIPASANVSSVLPKKDMNGDGTLDWSTVFINSEGEYKAANTYENLGDCQLNHQTWQTRCANADFNHDGLTDSWKLTFGSPRVFQYAYANYNGAPPVLTNTPITLQSGGIMGEEILGISDLNGDGYSDVLVRRAVQASSYVGTAKVEVFLHTRNNAAPYTGLAHYVYTLPARKSGSTWVLDENIELAGDFDGNGIDDIFVFHADFSPEVDPNETQQFHKPRFRKVLFSQSNSNGYSNTISTYGDGTTPGFGGPIPNYANHEMLFDLNGDGLLDVIGLLFGSSFQYKINLGDGTLSDWLWMTGSNDIVTKLKKGFVPQKMQSSGGGGGFPGFPITYNEQRLAPSFVLDYDQDGRPEMLIPHDRVVSFCYDHGVMISTSGIWGVQRFCDDEMYRIGEDVSKPQPPLSDSNDRSLYRYHRVRFEVTGYSSANVPLISATMEPTDLVATLSQGATADVFGNGHSDFLTTVICVTTGTNCTFGDANGNNSLEDFLDAQGAPLTVGSYINRNTGSFGSASAEMSDYEVVDKMKSSTTPLGVRTEWDYLPLNTGKAGPDFYSANHADLGSTPGYMHFSANINVVHEVRHSDGRGGLRAYRYKYQDATLNALGRGFQGYERIIIDDIANELRTVSDYHIKFPLSGQLTETRSCLLGAGDIECDGLPIEQVKYEWDLWRDGVLRQTVNTAATNYDAQVLENTAAENRYWVSPKSRTETQYQTSSSQSAGTGALQPITVSSLWTHERTSEQTFNSNSCRTFAGETYQEPAGANKTRSETTTVYNSANTSTWWLCKTNYEITLTKAVSGRTGDYATIEPGSDAQKQIRKTFTWDTLHRKPSLVTTEVLQGNGRPTRVSTTYNGFGLPTTTNVEGSTYNSNSYNLADRFTNTTYTADGYFPYTTTNAKGHVTTTLTDERYGEPAQITDPNGQVTIMTYDGFGRLRSSKAPGEPTVRNAYWWCSGVNGGTAWCPGSDNAKYRVITRSVGAPDQYKYYDSMVREVYSLVRNFTNDNWYRSRRRYDARGLVRWEYENMPAAARVSYFDGYDNLGRVTKTRKPQANDTYLQTNYAYNGHTVDVTAQSSGVGATTIYMSRQYNGLEQLVTTVDAESGITRYAYDGAGNAISLQDAKNNIITTKFNALRQKEWVHDPNAGDRAFGYNSLGELEWEQDANGDTLTYQYDELGRIFNRWTNGTYSGIWRYDNSASYGRKGMIDYEYNTTSTLDRLTKYYRYGTTTGGKDYLYYTWHYIYENGSLPASNRHRTIYYVDNNFGRPKGMSYDTTGLKLQYEYNAIGYMSHVKNAASGYTYREITDLDARGNVIDGLLGDSMMNQVQSHHPATGQMTLNRVTKASNGDELHELEYDYDGFGNLYQSIVTASNGLQNYELFTYDDLHRLTRSERIYSSTNRPNDVVDYSYDSVGNITAKTDYVNGSLTYGNASRNLGGNAGPNAVRTVNRIVGGTTNYSYDNNGNMLSGDDRTMTYNEFNKPLTVARSGVTSAFSYGADLLRYKQVKTGLPGGTQTTYHVDRHLEIEKQGTRTTYRHYLDGIAILNKESIGSSTQWTLGFHLKDRLGSVVTLTDQDATVLEHRSYDPFGKPRRGDFVETIATPTVDIGTIQAAITQDPHPPLRADPLTDRGFSDHEHLDEQQVIHMNGRAYDYNIGRFTTVDPLIQNPAFSQSVNPYSYIMNNPLAGIDPSGYQSEELKEDTDVEMENVAPTTGSRLKSNTTYSDYNGNSITTNRAGRIVRSTGTFSVEDGVITLGASSDNNDGSTPSEVGPLNPFRFEGPWRYDSGTDDPEPQYGPRQPENQDESKGWLEAIWDNMYFETGLVVGFAAKVDLVVVNAAIGTPTAGSTYRVTGDGDEGRYTVTGWSAGIQTGRVSFGRTAPNRVIERFDSDNPEGRTYVEEVAEGGFITSSDGTVRADSDGKLGVSLNVGFFRIKLGLDVHNTIFEATE